MKYLIVTASFLILFVFNSSATHNLAGEIIVEHVKGLEYKATIVTYTKVSSVQADRDSLILSWGDGTVLLVPRKSELIIANGVKKNSYSQFGSHIYFSPGIYTISVEDPNRNAGVINIPVSVNKSFYIETVIDISDTLSNGHVNSVDFNLEPILFAHPGTIYKHNPSPIDPDGDSLLFELVPCKGLNGQNISGYSFPANISIHSSSGEITWQVPQILGIYDFAIKISEFRNGYLMGHMIRDFQVTVIPQLIQDIRIDGLEQLELNEEGIYSYTLSPNEKFEVYLTISSNDKSYTPIFRSNTELYSLDNSAICDPDWDLPLGTVGCTYGWTPQSKDARGHPYIFVVRGNLFQNEGFGNSILTNKVIQKDVTFLLYARSEPAGIDVPLAASPSVIVYPNPFGDHIFVNVDRNEPYDIQIYNLQGKMVHLARGFGSGRVDLYMLPRGMYIYQLMQKGLVSEHGKMVKLSN
ncbi:MAG: T9SS type A sorting domain-containing protein [Bacteroidetes bacterium]|nr:T9SS type A sorting domain-containing protein [Bacteroidota bacterium]